ncbi:unnamed protein product, partial [Prorocentrum cordatum]
MDDLLLLATASARSVCTVAACASLGVYARRQGAITEESEKVLDKLVTSVFLPCLILSRMTPHITPADIASIWPLAVVCLCVVSCGLAAGAAVSLAVPGAREHRGLLMTAVAFPNSFAVPLTLVLALGPHRALLGEGAGAVRGFWQPSESAAEELRARVEFLFLTSYSLWVMARWGIGFPILTGAISFQEWRAKVLNPPVKACLLAAAAGLAWRGLRPAGPLSAAAVEAGLAPLTAAVAYGGRCSVPVLLMALGMKLDAAAREAWTVAPPPRGADADVERAKMVPAVIGAAMPGGAEPPAPAPPDVLAPGGARPLPLGAHLAVLALRQVAGPLLGAGLAGGVLRGLCGVTDSAILMVGMMQTAGPPTGE